MTEVTPSKQHLQLEFERFQNRLASYKKHSEECSRKYQHTFDSLVEYDFDQTSFLKTKFLQSKEKRVAKKKNFDSLNNNNNASGFFQKKREDENEPPTKMKKLPAPNNTAATHGNIIKFPAETLQHLDYSSLHGNLRISNNVTVKALNTSFKNDMNEKKPIINQNMIMSAVPPHAPVGVLPAINSPTIPNPIVNFKQEPREYNESDFQSLQPMNMNFELSQDAFSSLLSDIFVEENKDSVYTHNYQQPLQQQASAHQRPSQVITHQQHHQAQQHSNNSRPQKINPFHKVTIKVEDVCEIDVKKSQNEMSNQFQIQQQMYSTQQLHQVSSNQQMQLFKQQEVRKSNQRQQLHQHNQQPTYGPSTTPQPKQTPSPSEQYKQQLFQQSNQMQSVMRAQPPDNTQFAGVQGGAAQRLPEHNPIFRNGTMLRPPSSNNRTFSEELITLSQQKFLCHQQNRLPNIGGINADWRNMTVLAQQRDSQPGCTPNNIMQTRGGPIHNNMNMIANRMQQIPTKSPKPLHMNYGGQLNLQVKGTPNQTYNLVSNNPSVTVPNSCM